MFGIYPGPWIDGAFHAALNRAVTDVRNREKFYLDGQRFECSVKVSGATPKEWAYTAHRAADGETLVTLFNFSTKPLRFEVAGAKAVEVAAGDVGFLQRRR